ncbi:MAG TPA: cupin domain-containing protein [Thermomicrobiales bacterium]|jgi:mannose-6-phosphate isomerase-like protein (cupin superfamily)
MTEATERFQTVYLPADYDELAPDTSEIRVLGRTGRGSTAHGTLPPGATALAIVHRTVDEIWYVLSGRAEIWRKRGEHEEIVEAGPGTSLTIPVGTSFQFRTVGDEPFCFVMFTMPPWPGDDEARRVPDHWPVDRSR